MIDRFAEWMVDGNGLFALLGALGIAIGLLIVAVAFDARADAACLRAGYPSARLDWKLTAYCIKRVEQTDVVVPLSEVTR